MKRKSQQHTMGVPMVLFRGSLSGLGLRCALLLGFAPLSLPRWVACALGALCVPLCLELTSCPFDGTPLLCVGDTNGDRFTAVDQGEKAHAGVFKSSPSRTSDELTGTCRSQECRGNWMLDFATLFEWAGGQTGQVPHGKLSHTRTSSTRTFRGWSRAKPTHPTGERHTYREVCHTVSSQWL